MNQQSPQTTSFFASRAAWITALLVILLLGLAIRLYDLTDLPLDYHPTRQLLSALKARGMYYQTLRGVSLELRDIAIQQWKTRASVEPAFIERLVALTYRWTGEELWVPRLYSSMFWMTGAVFLFLLAREITSVDGALASTAIYLFLPYGIIASRSFQPDPLMVMSIIIFWWAVYNWSLTLNPSPREALPKGAGRGAGVRAWTFAILAGLFGGFAIYIKFVAAFFVIGGGLGAALGRESIRETLRRPQVYAMSVLGILPGAAYLIYGIWIAGFLGQQFEGRFIPAMLLSPNYYLGWVAMLNLVIGSGVLTCAFIGSFFFEKEKLRFMLGLWSAYALFGIYFNYHISSHDYYSLPLIPIVALSIAPLAEMILARLKTSVAGKSAVTVILLFGIFASLWDTRTGMKSVDYRPEAAMWAEIGKTVGVNNVAGLTPDYGSRLSYWGWKDLTAWPSSGDLTYHADLRGAQPEFDKQFEKLALMRVLFLVTDFDELESQPLLKERLLQYPVFAEGDGYVIHDLGN